MRPLPSEAALILPAQLSMSGAGQASGRPDAVPGSELPRAEDAAEEGG